ncbi:MAG TPA: sensor histidine kinase, partial [Burkholderiaceae bacterium]
VLLTWLVAQNLAARPYDHELAEVASELGRQSAETTDTAAHYAVASQTLTLLRANTGAPVYYQVSSPQGLLSGEPGLPPPPDDELGAPGQVNLRDQHWAGLDLRVAALHVAQGDPQGPKRLLLVQVAETRTRRDELANAILKGVILPQFVVLPLAVLLAWLALARGIAPLNELQVRIRSRASTDLSPLDESKLHDDVAPLVSAINDLLARLDQSIGAQKHFLADAAHQLKTPLAGLRTQAELAQREIEAGRGSAEELRGSLAQIALSSERAAHMVNQLLAMAHAEDREHAARHAPLRLSELAVEVVRDFVPRALEKRIDLGYEGPDAPSLPVLGYALMIRELIRNLVDNALLYTPAGGTVTVRIVDDPFGQVSVLQVEDSGPGVPLGEREKVFQPFYRALGTAADGSGLGLAIVREIVNQHGAELSLEPVRDRPAGPHEGPGARFTVRFRTLKPSA